MLILQLFCLLLANHDEIVTNRIGGVMVSVLASSAVDRGFETRSDQTEDYEILYLLLLR